MAMFSKSVTAAKVRYFDESERAEALKWIEGDESE
jgi:hypothetical protein